MAKTSLQPGAARANADVLTEFAAFEHIGYYPLAGDDADHASKMISFVGAWSTILAVNFEDASGAEDVGKSIQFSQLNPTIISSAMNGLAHCAAMAAFFLDRYERRPKEL